MPREGNSAGKLQRERRAASYKGKGGDEDTPEVREILRRHAQNWRENPAWIRERTSVREQNARAQDTLDEVDSLSKRIADHEHFISSPNYPYNPVNNSRLNELYNYARNKKNNLEKEAQDFYGSFDNPKYAGTPGRDRENDNSRRVMDMDAKARARQAARSRNNPTNPNDR